MPPVMAAAMLVVVNDQLRSLEGVQPLHLTDAGEDDGGELRVGILLGHRFFHDAFHHPLKSLHGIPPPNVQK